MYSRIVRVVQSCIMGNNYVINVLAHLALHGSGSFVSKSCNLIMSELNIVYTDFINKTHNYFLKRLHDNFNYNLDDVVLHNSYFIQDLLSKG